MTSKVYNPFSKAFWTKENLKVEFKEVKIKEVDTKKSEEVSRKLLAFGEKMQKIAWQTMWGLTIPILLTIFLGLPGLGIGILLFLGMLGGMFNKK